MPCQWRTRGDTYLHSENSFSNVSPPIKSEIKITNHIRRRNSSFFDFRKILSTTILIGVLALPNISYARNYSRISDDVRIEKALSLLEESHSDKTLNILMGENSSHKPIKIMFYSLIMLSPKYSDAYALATSDDDGNMYILIDSKYKDEPPEALASLIAHEATHQLSKTTIDEEIQAWTNETRQWIELKKTRPELSKYDENKYKLVRRLNYLEKLYVTSNNSNELIAEAVLSNTAYRLLSMK